MRERITALVLFGVLTVLFVAASTVPVQNVSAERAGTFAGTWIASGQRQGVSVCAPAPGKAGGHAAGTGHVKGNGYLRVWKLHQPPGV